MTNQEAVKLLEILQMIIAGDLSDDFQEALIIGVNAIEREMKDNDTTI